MPKLCAVQIFALHSRCNQGISYFRANAQLCPLWAAADCSNLIRRRQSSIALSVYSLARVFSSGSPRVSRSSRSRGCVSAFQAALTTGSLEFHGGVANRWRTLSPSLTAEQARDRSFHNCWILCIGGVLAVGVSAGRTPRSAGWPLGHLVACVVYFAVHIGKVRVSQVAVKPDGWISGGWLGLADCRGFGGIDCNLRYPQYWARASRKSG